MLSKKQAMNIIRNTLPETMEIIENDTVETEYGWVIFSQTKKYIESRNLMDMAIGSGGTLVEKSTGNLYKFGSGFSLEENLKIYELGYFKYKNWDIQINAVRHEAKAIELLSQLELNYMVPERAYGEVWTISKKYSPIQLKNKLKQLPVKFNIGSIYFQYSTIESYKGQDGFTYELLENKGYVNTI